jgi:hypothetical protein
MARVLWAADNRVYAARVRRGIASFSDGAKGRVARVACKKTRARATLVAFPFEYVEVEALASLRDACERASGSDTLGVERQVGSADERVRFAPDAREGHGLCDDDAGDVGEHVLDVALLLGLRAPKRRVGS